MSDYSHQRLMDLAHSLGYNLEKKGVCAGYTQMWVQAAVLGDEAEEAFFNRIDYICEISIAEINSAIKLVKEKRGRNLTEDDKKLIDLLSFFEGIRLYLYPFKHREVFGGQFISQSDAERISSITSSIELSKNLNSQAISSLPIVYSKLVTGNKRKLIDFFMHLKNFLIALSDENIVLTLGSGFHRIGLRFNVKKNKWISVDANNLPKEEIDPSKLIDFVIEKLSSSSACSFEAVFYTAPERAERVKRIFESHQFNEEEAKEEKVNATSLARKLKECNPLTRDTALEKSDYNSTLFSLAAGKGRTNVISEIFELFHPQPYPYVNLINHRTKLAPIHQAVSNNYLEMAVLLIEHGADLELMSEDELLTPLHWAVVNNHLAMTDILLAAGAKVNAIYGINKISVIHTVAASNNVDMAEKLLRNGAKVDVVDANGLTALHKAAEANQPNMLRCLMVSGRANPNFKSKQGTPLSIAIQKGHWDCVMVMLILQPDLKNISKKDLSSLSSQGQKEKLVEAFIKYVNTLSRQERDEQIAALANGRNALGMLFKPRQGTCCFFGTPEKSFIDVIREGIVAPPENKVR